LTLLGMFAFWYVASVCDSVAARAEALHLLVATIVWGISFLHLRARRTAEEERQAIEEAERVRLEEGRAQLFERAEGETGMAQARLREMERYGAPIASALIIFLQFLFGGWFLYALSTVEEAPGVAESLGITPGAELSNTALAAALAFGVAFFSFALGKYAAGMSGDPRARLLRAGAGYTIGCSILLLLLTVSYALGYTGWIVGDRILAWAVPSVLLLLGAEMLINFLLDFYRPRVRGEEPRPVYDSRLTGLLAEPKGLFRTFAHTLDYQFGFRVSETWFFRFLNRAIAPLILFQLGALYLLTCVVIVQPGEVAVIERWGRPLGVQEALPSRPTVGDSEAERARKEEAWDALGRRGRVLEPGAFHLKWPWPIDVVRRVRAEDVRQVYLGQPVGEEGRPPKGSRVVSWDIEHRENEYRYLMPLFRKAAGEVGPSALEGEADDAAGPGEAEDEIDATVTDTMFISGQVVVHYTIGRRDADGKIHPGDIYRYLYRHSDPTAAMQSVGEQALTRYLAGANFWDVLVYEIDRTERRLRERIQQAADRQGLGVEISFVSLVNMHPPVGEVGKAYQAVISAREEMWTKIHQANATAAQKLAGAPGEAEKLRAQARGYRKERVLVAEARAKRFQAQMEAHSAAPEVYLYREKLLGIEQALKGAKKGYTVLPRDVITVFDAKRDVTAEAMGQALVEEMESE
jgi:regulator of protease activity HflC (stomatin/prohibitin superfamily)